MAPVDSIIIPFWRETLVSTPSKHDVDPMLDQSWPTGCDAGPASNKHWFNASCLLGCVQLAAVLVLLNTAGGDYKPTPTQCLLIVGQYPFSPSQYLMLPVTACWQYGHDALNQSWVNVGQPSVTLAHIQRGAKHNTVTRYWANVGSAS